MSDIVYFELNNWFPGRDYPNALPFTKWCGCDQNLTLCDETFVKENNICVVCSNIDMSVNWCISATREWVEQNCPKLLSDESTVVTIQRSDGNGRWEDIVEEYPYSKFLRYPDKYGEVRGRFGTQFLEYKEENIGITWIDEYEE